MANNMDSSDTSTNDERVRIYKSDDLYNEEEDDPNLMQLKIDNLDEGGPRDFREQQKLICFNPDLLV